jgi:hypothetical protein
MHFVNRRIILIVTIVLVFSLSLLGCSSSNETAGSSDDTEKSRNDYLINMGTASSGGAFYVIGAGISNFLSEEIDGLNMRAMVTSGAVDNINLLERGEIKVALAASGFAYSAYNGEGQWEGREQKNLRAVTYLYDSVFHFVTRKDTGIEKLEDLRGTKGSPGGMASGADIYTQHVLEEVDIDYKDRNDLTPEYTDFNGAADLMKDGHIDWAALPIGVPGGVIMDLANTLDINLLPMEGETRDSFLEKRPYYVEALIPAGTYKGIDKDIQTAAAPALLIVDESLDEELVYEMTKVIFENLDVVKEFHSSLNGMGPDRAMDGVAIPLHPGTERYYKEVGII